MYKDLDPESAIATKRGMLINPAIFVGIIALAFVDTTTVITLMLLASLQWFFWFPTMPLRRRSETQTVE